MIVLLQMVDPYNNQKMTYSEVVHLLSSHMVPAYDEEDGGGNGQMTSVLEKFVNIRSGGSYFEKQQLNASGSHSRKNTAMNDHHRGGAGGQEDIRAMIMNLREDTHQDEDDQQHQQQQHDFEDDDEYGDQQA